MEGGAARSRGARLCYCELISNPPSSSMKDTWKGCSTGGISVINTCCREERREGGREGEKKLKLMCDTEDMRSHSPQNVKVEESCLKQPAGS